MAEATMEFWTAAWLVTLAMGELVALAGIWLRYAIPRSPRIFHILLAFTMVPALIAALCLAYVSIARYESLWGYGLDVYRAVFFPCEAATFWILVGYAVYFHLRGRHCPA